jgi:hypothetical protein
VLYVRESVLSALITAPFLPMIFPTSSSATLITTEMPWGVIFSESGELRSGVIR